MALLKQRLSRCESFNTELLRRIDSLNEGKTVAKMDVLNSNYETNQQNTKAKKPQSLGTNAILKSKLFNQQLEQADSGKSKAQQKSTNRALAKFTNYVIESQNNLNVVPQKNLNASKS